MLKLNCERNALMAGNKLKILFMNYGPYFGCSGVHIHFLANALADLGHDCHVFLPDTRGSNEYFGECNYAIHDFPSLVSLPVEFFEDAILHIWTTREAVRIPTAILRKRVKLPYLVHLEDNEVLITGRHFGINNLEEQKTFAKNNPEKFEKFLDTHPLYFESFMRNSLGVSCIIDKLQEFVPQGVPTMTFWPSCEDAFFNLSQERNIALRKGFEFDDDTFAIVYPGAVHHYNVQSFIELLLAIDRLNDEGFTVKLVRSGIEFDGYDEAILDLYRKHVLFVEDLNSSELPRLMALADILVQIGTPGDFDDYRFPSKVPFFLASGRPVILPQTNVAKKLKHGLDCFMMKKGDADEIVKYLKMLMGHAELAKNMGMQGRATARNLFSWEKAAKSLVPFYEDAKARFHKG